MKKICKHVIVSLVVAAFVAATVTGMSGARTFALADEAEAKGESSVHSAVDELRKGDASGWSVVSFDGTETVAATGPAAANYIYYTLQEHTGKAYEVGAAKAFVPDKIIHKVSADCLGPDEDMVNDEKYGIVLVNDGAYKMALAYTAPSDGTLYYRDLAQVAPLHYDERANAGVYGEYRVVKLGSDGEVVQLYPESGVHELYASNGAPTTSAYVDSSVEIASGERILFVSEKADSTVFSSPTVSFSAFDEVYEFKYFWKWQQINDANYFEVGYRNANGVWQAFPNLETKKGEYDIYPRSQAPYQSALYWTPDNPYMFAFGGMWVHASSVQSADGVGDVGYAFKVPHSGYVDVKLNALGHYMSEIEVFHNDEKLYAATEADRVNIFHYGFTYEKKALAVSAGDVLYFVQTSELGPSPQDLNPIITYIDDPYTLDETEISLSGGEEKTLALSLNSAFGLNAEDAVWSVSPEGVATVEAEGLTATVKAVNAGEAVVSVAVGGYVPVTCAVKVSAVNKFAVSKESVETVEGGSEQITVSVTDDSLSLDDIEVVAEDDGVVSVSLDGGVITVTGISVGRSEVYVTAAGSKSVTLTVTVTERPEEQSGEPTSSSAMDGSEETKDKKGGCGASVGSSAVSLLAATAACLVLVKRKKR